MLKFLMCFCFIINSYALLVLDVELTHEKGLDDKTILKSELLSKEVVHSGKELVLQMKNGLNLKIKAHYDSSTEDINQSTIIKIEGIVKNIISQNDKVNEFKLETTLGKSGEYHFEPGDGQKTTINVTPRNI